MKQFPHGVDQRGVAPKGIWSFCKHFFRDVSNPKEDITNKYKNWVIYLPIVSFLLILSSGFGAYIWFKQFGPLSFYVLSVEDNIYLTLVGIFWSLLFLLAFFLILLCLLSISIPIAIFLRGLGLGRWIPSDDHVKLFDWKASMNLARMLILLLFSIFIVNIGLIIGPNQLMNVIIDTVANAIVYSSEGQSKLANWPQIVTAINSSNALWINNITGGIYGVILFFVLLAVAELFDHSSFHQDVSRIIYMAILVMAPCIGSYFYLDVMHPLKKVEVFYADTIKNTSHVCADRTNDTSRMANIFQTDLIWSGTKATLIRCTDKKSDYVLIQGPENLRIQLK